MKKYNKEFADDSTEAWYVVGKVFLGIFAVAIVVFLLWGEWLTHRKAGCMFLLLFNMYCPGCGCTRAFNHLVHLHVWTSFLCNPFVLVTVVMYSAFMINTFLCHHTKKLGFTSFPVTKLVYADLILLILQWVIRNVLYVGWGLTVL
ncbi:MAG: DUF2752 domain-containing protein [Lachnospiraceae bacterium]|nr:DUF2752 domain-containing protein [Lachnospiraceae bacterium]